MRRKKLVTNPERLALGPPAHILEQQRAPPAGAEQAAPETSEEEPARAGKEAPGAAAEAVAGEVEEAEAPGAVADLEVEAPDKARDKILECISPIDQEAAQAHQEEARPAEGPVPGAIRTMTSVGE